MSLKTAVCLLAVLIVIGILPVSGKEYRVTSAAEIASIMGASHPGDTLTMVNGIWSNAAIVLAGYGTASLPIVLRAESYGGVVLTGTSTLRISGSNVIVDGLMFRNGYSPSGAVIEFQSIYGEADSCRVTNCSIMEYNPAVLTTNYKWISLYGTHNRVDHCYIRGKTHQGSTLVVWVDTSKSNYHLIDHNFFAPRPSLGVNGGETIRVGTGIVSSGNSCTTVEYNYFDQCNGDAEIISNKSCGNTFRYNTFVSCQGTISMRQGHRAVIEGNFIFGNKVKGTGGIRLMGSDHKVFNNYVTGVDDDQAGCGLALMNGTAPGITPSYLQVQRATIAFNTIVSNAYAIGYGINDNGGVLAPDSCIIANNVVYGTNAKPLITVYTAPTNFAYQGNIFFGGSLGMTQPTGITWIEPQLAVAADGLWRPGTTSPVINAAADAASSPYVSYDVDGQGRDSLPDVGADEISSAAISRRPLTPADVGPPPAMITTVEDGYESKSLLPLAMELKQNYPNPFNPATAVEFTVPMTGHVAVKVYTTVGQVVAILFDGVAEGGRFYRTTFDGSRFSSGIYLYTLETAAGRIVRRMTMLK